MERENLFRSELTTQGQNSYSNSEVNIMSEPGASEIKPPSAPIKEGPTAVNPEVQKLADKLRAAGIQIDGRGLETLRQMIDMGIVPTAIGSEDNPQPTPENPIPVGQLVEKNITRKPGESDEEYRIRREDTEKRLREGKILPSEIEEAPDPEKFAEAVKKIEDETAPKTVIDWLVDPKARMDYFNEIYALVDSRPYDFWNQAFDSLNDGAYEHHFNQTLLLASKGEWQDIKAGPRSMSDAPVVNVDRIKLALAAKRGISPSAITDAEIADLRVEIKRDFDRFQSLRQLRRTLHDVNAVLYLPTVKAEDLFNNMQQFDSASGDLAYSTPGVKHMMDIYEGVLREGMMENNGYLDPQFVIGKTTSDRKETAEAETRAKERFRKMVERGLVKTRVKGVPSNATTLSNDLKDWDVDRIFVMARGMLIMNERLLSLAAESELPKETIRYASGFLQDVMGGYSSFAHTLAKWSITSEALGAYLFENKPNKKLAELFQGWDPKELQKNFKLYNDDPTALYRDLDNVFYLSRRNPNRAGDVFTWTSWRGQLDPDTESMYKDYLVNGQKRMQARWDAAEGRPDNLKSAAYESFLRSHPIDSKLSGNAKKQAQAERERLWRQTNPNSSSLATYLAVKDEYENWAGTAFRFEKLRGDLSEHNSEEAEAREKFHKTFNEKAKPIIKQMVDLQPHRLYLVSKFVRQRVNSRLGLPETLDKDQQAAISKDLENLSMVEAAMLNDRERLLDEGYTFATITPEVLERYYEMALPGDKPAQDRAKRLAQAVKEDYAAQSKLNDKENAYYKEFVFNREYTHGYVLWSGDTPGDELNFSSLGATGGFVRRARDNQNQAKAGEAETKLLDNLKNIQTPDQLQESLFEIFSHIDHYDRHKAKQAIAEKAEGYIKFFKASWRSKIPLYRQLRGGKLSYARMAYGPHAPAWESSDIYHFIDQLEHKHMIDEAGHKRLLKVAGATKKHLLYESGSTLAWFFMYAVLGMGADIFKEATDDVEG